MVLNGDVTAVVKSADGTSQEASGQMIAHLVLLRQSWEAGARVEGTATVVLLEHRPDLPSGGGARPTPVDATVRLGPTVLGREGRRDETLRLPEVEIAATLGVPAGGGAATGAVAAGSSRPPRRARARQGAAAGGASGFSGPIASSFVKNASIRS
jgi:hypothetical protein